MLVWERYHLKGTITQRQEIGKDFSADPLAFNTNLNLIEGNVSDNSFANKISHFGLVKGNSPSNFL